MINLTRRDFSKYLGLACASLAIPTIAFAKPKLPEIITATINVSIPAQEYSFGHRYVDFPIIHQLRLEYDDGVTIEYYTLTKSWTNAKRIEYSDSYKKPSTFKLSQDESTFEIEYANSVCRLEKLKLSSIQCSEEILQKNGDFPNQKFHYRNVK